MNDAFSLPEAMSQVAVTLAGFGAIATGPSAVRRRSRRRRAADQHDDHLAHNMHRDFAPARSRCSIFPKNGSGAAPRSSSWLFKPPSCPALRARAPHGEVAGFHALATFINQALVVSGFILFGLCALGWPAGNLDAMFVASGFAMLTVSAISFPRGLFDAAFGSPGLVSNRLHSRRIALIAAAIACRRSVRAVGSC